MAWYIFAPEAGKASPLEVFLLQVSFTRAGAFRGVTVFPCLGHSCCLASLSKICSKDVQHIRPSSCEGEVSEGLCEGFPSHPPEAAAVAAGSTDRDPRAVPGAGPWQQLCICSGEVVG